MSPKRLSDGKVRAAKERLDARDLLRPIHEICRAYNVPIESVLRKERSRRVVMARDACIERCASIGFSSVEVGRLFDMDHTSVLEALKRYRTRDNGKALT